MSFDAESHRRSSLEGWEAAASGWVRRKDLVRELGAPVTEWLLAAVAPQPGERVLELAAGLGETGMLAAEQVAPGGSVVISDQAEAMLEGARERAAELGLENVEFKVLNAEWIDLPVASFDVAICRWGYMLMADPATALGETRRVLRPGGRLALAVWDSVEANPWALLPAQELRERGLAPAADPSGPPPPGPFALGSAERVAELLGDAGYAEGRVEALDADAHARQLRGAVGDHARPLPRLPRRGASAPGGRDRADQGGARRALRSVRRRPTARWRSRGAPSSPTPAPERGAGRLPARPVG